MTTTVARLLVVLFAVAAVLCPAASTGQAADPTVPRQNAAIPTNAQKAPQEGRIPVDVDKLKKALPSDASALPAPKFVSADGVSIPRFREEVNVVAFRLGFTLSFAEQLEASEKADRYPYVYAPSLQELAATADPAIQYLHPVNAILAAHKAVSKALYRRKVEKARREVEADLKAFLAEQAKLAESKPPKKQP